MHILFPEIQPYKTHELAVDSMHTLHIEEFGSPDGIPALFIHGGPGGGSDHNSARFFDPTIYRVIVFDQRGAGRSTPYASLENNSTPDLIEDIEKIREHLSIEAWVLFGGSWGSTLSLLYAQAFPNRALALILRGIFLCRQRDLHWFYQEGASRLFPEQWQNYKSIVDQDKQDDFISAYHELLTSDNELKQMSAAKAWSGWEGCCSTLKVNNRIQDHFLHPKIALALARIESHFFVNNCFIDENQIIENMDKIAHIPGVIVHGRYDAVCPVDNAVELKHHWSEAQLHIIREAGHSAFEPGNTDALVKATVDTSIMLKQK